MRYLLSLLALLLAQFAFAQQTDSTIVFETEEVKEFKRQMILDEFQVPHEQDVTY